MQDIPSGTTAGGWGRLITYIYTPNQQTVWQDDQGNKFPKNAEEANSTDVLMGDECTYLDGWVIAEHWNHMLGDPQGANWMGGDGHVEWKNYHQQRIRMTYSTPWGLYERWW